LRIKGETKVKRLLAVIQILLLCGLLFPGQALAQEDEAPAAVSIPVGAILPLTGELGSKGLMRRMAIEMAVREVNNYLEAVGRSFRLALTVADSASDPDRVVREAEALRQAGTQIFIVGSSEETAAMKAWSDEHGTLVVSFSSSAPSLAVPGDGVFRVVPNDRHQAQALATLMEAEEIDTVITVHRSDVYGTDLARLLAGELEARGISTYPAISYEPGTVDFAPVIEQIGRRLEESDASARPAVVMLAFDEAQQILNLGGGLPAVRWFGGDSVALSPAVLRDETAARTAAAVRLTAVAFGIQNTPKFREVQGALEQAFQTAVVPDAVFAYDVPWMLATALEELEDPQDVAQLRERLPELAPQYIGATNSILFFLIKMEPGKG